MTQAASACTSQPVSWLALEQLALGELTAPAADRVRAHLAACPACAACLAQIDGDSIALPALPALPAAPRRAAAAPWWRRRWLLGSAGALAAIAAVLVIVVLPRGRRAGEDPSALAPRIRIKGAGEVIVGLVRDRGGATDLAPTTFAPGDRFKVVVTCDQAADVWADVAVFQAEPGQHDRLTASYPAAPLRLACGNHVPVPGAFTITGTAAATVCLALDVDHPPTREPLGRRKGIACYSLVPEARAR